MTWLRIMTEGSEMSPHADFSRHVMICQAAMTTLKAQDAQQQQQKQGIRKMRSSSSRSKEYVTSERYSYDVEIKC